MSDLSDMVNTLDSASPANTVEEIAGATRLLAKHNATDLLPALGITMTLDKEPETPLNEDEELEDDDKTGDCIRCGEPVYNGGDLCTPCHDQYEVRQSRGW